MGYDFVLGEEKVRVTPAYDRDGFDLVMDDARFAATLSRGARDGEYELIQDGHREPLFIASRGDEHFIPRNRNRGTEHAGAF